MTLPNPLTIMGAGGFARELFHWATHAGYHVTAFYDEHSPLTDIYGLPVIKDLTSRKNDSFAVGVGDPALRERFWELAKEKGLFPCMPIVHHTVVAVRAQIHRGAILCPGVICTDNVQIGGNVLLNLKATVGHDTIIERHCVVSPGANISGNVVIREKSYIGTNAAIREKIEIGARSIIGMGAVIVKPVAPDSKIVGAAGVRNLAAVAEPATLKPVNPNNP